ncbi:ATP-binding protein [Belliella sp. R4-6]|uniref:ATP-binding protein n=1 Tax=Belliella alkalica TaxID=1730871 RepID=A0ABS9V8M3_9BACT|nr:ATP-binding protein [Belliella alkalica]MCH7412298.1 ATP-binding protein [Belliella alkalica]
MRLIIIKIKNFRSYQEPIEIPVGDLTTLVGKNDIGKSTILEALDIFFNKGKGAIKMDKDDVNKTCLASGDNTSEISLIFDQFPNSIVIDSTYETSLESEYLLNVNGHLEIIKRYNNGGSEKIFIKANHPTNENCTELLLKTQRALQKIITDNEIECENRTINAIMRAAIWSHHSENLGLAEIEIDVTKGETKSIWDKLENYLPIYTLFQSDRKNSDGDNEVQDPLNEAVRQIMNDSQIQETLAGVAELVEGKLKEVAGLTLEKLREMNPEIADSLNPVIPSSDSLKWNDVFKKVSITGDEDIPINKRGSGVKRLILLNFFRAEAERRRIERNVPSVIYAIEEPETSQHTAHQKLLIKALIELSDADNTQILLTTHSPVIVKKMDFEHLRLIQIREGGKTVNSVSPGQLPYPSLNEVNFTAFEEVTEEYHNELYGFLESEGLINDFKVGKETIEYIRLRRDGTTLNEKKILTEYIRHQIHHPENNHNVRFSEEQISESIRLMRSFIDNQH